MITEIAAIAWPELPEPIRAGIVTILNTAFKPAPARRITSIGSYFRMIVGGL
jgi:hypothetical protein